MIYLQLFLSFLKIGAFSFGGGYAMIPLIMEETIEIHQWLSKPEFIDILAISQMTPGPIAINLATFLGFRITDSIAGSALATVAVVAPSFGVISLMFYFLSKFRKHPYVELFFQGIRPVVVGLIGAGFISVFRDGVKSFLSLGIFALVFYLVTFRKLHPILAMLLAALLGMLFY